MQALIVKWLTAFMRLPLLDFVPRGYLTKASGALQVVVGIGLLATAIIGWIQTGNAPAVDDLNNIIGVLLLGNGAAGIGTRRAMGK